MDDTAPRLPPTPSLPSKAYSCVRCFKRKVKCDKHHPCTACLRAKVDCIFRTPAPPRRRAPRAIDEAVFAQLKHYEDLLRANGIAFNSAATTLLADDSNSIASTPMATVPNQTSAHRFPSNPPLHPPSIDSLQGTLIVEHGRTRFIEKYIFSPHTGLLLTCKANYGPRSAKRYTSSLMIEWAADHGLVSP